jgi:hypothetical protein
MSDNNTNHGAPTHWFFESEATNFLFAHLFGLIMSLILTTLFGVLITSNIVVITLVFLIIEFFVASSIEGTKTSIKILKWDPVLFMGKLTGKYAGSGTYRQDVALDFEWDRRRIGF